MADPAPHERLALEGDGSLGEPVGGGARLAATAEDAPRAGWKVAPRGVATPATEAGSMLVGKEKREADSARPVIVGALPNLSMVSVEACADSAAEIHFDQDCCRGKAKSAEATDMERMPPRASLRVVYLLNFLMVANYTILVPKTRQYWENMDGDISTGLALARLLPLLKALSAWAFLWLSRKKSIAMVIATMIIGNVVGNIVFAFAPVTNSRWTVFIARIVLTSHEVQSVPNCYIGRAVGLRYRSEASMHNNAWFGLGYAAGPVLAYVLEKIAQGSGLEGEGVDAFDAETLPGWFMAIVWLLFLLLHRMCYEEPLLEAGERDETSMTALPDMNWVGIAMAGIVSFVMALTISSWEMWTLSMVHDRWGSPLIAGGYLAGVTIAVLPLAMLSGRLATLLDDRLGLFLTFVTAGASWSFLFRYFRGPFFRIWTEEITFFTVGSVGLLASMLVARGFFDALVSKLGPPDRKQQVITGATSLFMLGRGVGGSLGAWFTNQNTWVALHMSACFLTAVGILTCLKFLGPHRCAA